VWSVGMNPQIQGIVNDFVQQLSAVWHQSVTEALDGMSIKSNGKGGKRSFGKFRPKGEKRAPEEIAALKDKFTAFVKSHPGLRIEQINKELGTSTKDLALPIRQLISDGVIKAVGAKRSTVYKSR